MRIGQYTVESVIDGRFGLDGGSMFGVVPRALWEKSNPPDENNRIDLAARCLLIRGAERCILVETGIGRRFDEKRAAMFKVSHPDGDLIDALAARGIAPEEVTDVILTHLHFDHCGGTTRRDGDGLALAFPEATHHVQRRNWEWAHQPSRKDAGSFRAEDFSLLERSPLLHLLDGGLELFAGVHLQVAEGHTPGMQMVRVEGPEVTLLFCADLVPTRGHLRWPYVMAYDNQPLVTLAEKLEILPRAAADGWIVVFGHDPDCDAAVLAMEGDAVVIDREVELGG